MYVCIFKMFHLLFSLLICLTFGSTFSQKDPAHWIADRSTIVHLFEWKWTDIADECERFLQYKGYAGVQVSPVTENAVVKNRPWWERYEPVSYKLQTRSGNEMEFQSMVDRCGNVGIRIYVDVILNHMASGSNKIIGTAGTTADSSQLSYPGVPYGPSDFHASCKINNYYNADQVRTCEDESSKDLDQAKPSVRDTIVKFMNHLIDMGVAGFRIGAAKYMSPADLLIIYSRLKDLKTDFGFAPGSRPYIYQEVIDIGEGGISKYEYIHLGTVTEYKHSAEISRVFSGKDKLKHLVNWGPEWGLLQSKDALVYVDYHANQRENDILKYKNAKQYKMAIAFMLAHTYGTPRIISSYAFEFAHQGPPQDKSENVISPGINPDDTCSNGWICEHRWRQIYNMVGFKNTVKGTEITNFWSNKDNDQQIAFCRGNKGFIAFTNGGDLTQTLNTCLPSGTYCDIISGKVSDKGECTGKVIKVAEDGTAFIEILANDFDGVLAIHVKAKL